jgi:hypothetical protein
LLSKRPVGDEVPRIDCLRLYLGPNLLGTGPAGFREHSRLLTLAGRALDRRRTETLMIFAYLWLVFLVFLVHEWIVLADHHIGFRFYGLAAINAWFFLKSC